MLDRHAHQGALLGLLLFIAAACGGDAGVKAHRPGPGPKVSGTVELPNGDLAARPSLWWRLATSIVRRAQALIVDNLAPAGPNVSVLLFRVDPADILNGEIQEGQVLFEAFTNRSGRYEVQLPSGSDENTCRFLVRVGSPDDGTLTRAFVYSTDSPIDINVQSEAAVRLILDAIAAGRVGLCDFSADEIDAIYAAIDRSDAVATGNTVEELNASGEAAAAGDPQVQAAIAAAIGPPPSTATATHTPVAASATPTHTPTPQAVVTTTRTASRTATEVQTLTPTASATRTSGRPSRTVANTATATPTETPTGVVTSSNTPEATPTITPTETATPTSTPSEPETQTPTTTATETPTTTPTQVASTTPTATSTAGASATATPSDTPAASPTATVTRTNTSTASQTPTPTLTPTATRTFAATSTSTPLAGVRVNVGLFGAAPGLLSGTAGAFLDVPVSLVTSGASTSAVSNDLVYDSAVLDVEMVQGIPDCNIDAALAGAKEIVARVTPLGGSMKRLRVGLFGGDNQDELSDGNLYRCRFLIDPAAAGATTLDNTPRASSPQGADVAATGADGSLTISGTGPVLALSTGSAAAGAMVDVVASLMPNGAQLSAVATDIRFDSTRVGVVEGAAGPDCTVDESIGDTSAFDKEVFAAVRDSEEPDRQILRVGVVSRLNNEVLPDIGTPLPVFRCRFMLGGESGSVALEHTARASDPSGLEIGLNSLPGEIGVQ